MICGILSQENHVLVHILKFQHHIYHHYILLNNVSIYQPAYSCLCHIVINICTMKSVHILALHQQGNLYIINANNIFSATFTGLKLEPSLPTLFLLRKWEQFSCQWKFSKKDTQIKFKSLKFYEEMLTTGSASLIKNELQSSKFLDNSIKQTLFSLPTEANQQKKWQLFQCIIDCCQNNELIPKIFQRGSRQARIERLNENILLNFPYNNKVVFLPVKLRNIEHNFQLVDQQLLLEFIKQYQCLQVHFESCKYNLLSSCYQVEVYLPEAAQKKILENGWGTVALQNMKSIKCSLFNQYIKLEREAKFFHKGLFLETFNKLSLIYRQEFKLGVIQEVIEGHCFMIRMKENDEICKFQLETIDCPRNNDAGAFCCRQFSRKNLIGKECKVYVSKQTNFNIFGSLVRSCDNKDIQKLIIQNGFGTIKNDQTPTNESRKLTALVVKAKLQNKGMHNRSFELTQFYQDFSIGYGKKAKSEKWLNNKRRYQFLNEARNKQLGVIIKFINITTFIVRIDNLKKIVKVKLVGITKTQADKRLKQVIQINKDFEGFFSRNLNQRDVYFQLLQYDEQTSSYFGNIFSFLNTKQKKSYQQILLQRGFAVIASNTAVPQQWVKAEASANTKQIGCWSRQLRQLTHGTVIEDQEKQFKGKISWVEDGETVYIQPASRYQKLDYIQKVLSNHQNLSPLPLQSFVPKYICVALFESQMYRARIISNSEDNKSATVMFIDWGNKSEVPFKAMRELPTELMYLPAMCFQAKLDLVKPQKAQNQKLLSPVRQYLQYTEYKLVKQKGNIVNLFVGNCHVNAALIYECYLGYDRSKLKDQKLKKWILEQRQKRLSAVK